MIKIPDGYRQLNPDELVIEGDKFYATFRKEWKLSSNWNDCDCYGKQGSYTYIRKMTDNTLNMKLQIENKSFTLNIARAVELGVLTPDKVLITDIKAGDRFKHRGGGAVSTVISISSFNTWLPENDGYDMYVLAGFGGNQSAVYTTSLRNKKEMLDELNAGGEYVKVS